MVICVNNVIPGTNLSAVKLDMHFIHTPTREIQNAKLSSSLKYIKVRTALCLLIRFYGLIL